MFLEVEEGWQDRDKEAVKVYLIRFIVDLPLRLVYGLRDWVPLSFMFTCLINMSFKNNKDFTFLNAVDL